MLEDRQKKNELWMYKWILGFIALQPLLDLFTSLNVRFFGGDILSLGVVIRSLFMVSLVLYIFLSKTHSMKVKIYYLVVGVYLCIFFYLAYDKGGIELLFPEIKGVIKSFYFPIILVALFELNRIKKIQLSAKLFQFILGAYLAVIFIASISGTSFNSYSYGYGSVGWFYAANEIGAIIAMLIPFSLLPFLENKTKYSDFVLFLLLIFSIFYIGTKVPPLSLVIYMGMMGAVMIWRVASRKKKAFTSYLRFTGLVLFLGILISIQSPLSKNLVSNYGQFFDGSGEILTGEITDQERLEEEQDKKIEQAILSSRNLYNDMIRERFEQSSLTGKVFGIGYYVRDDQGEFTDKMIEMDAYDILYRHGIVGSIIYFLPLMIIGLMLLKRFFEKFNENMNAYRVVSYCYSIIIGLAVGLLTGHVLTSPAVSIYIVVSILMLDAEIRQLNVNRQPLNENIR